MNLLLKEKYLNLFWIKYNVYISSRTDFVTQNKALRSCQDLHRSVFFPLERALRKFRLENMSRKKMGSVQMGRLIGEKNGIGTITKKIGRSERHSNLMGKIV